MRKLRAGASSAQFRDSGPEAAVNSFAGDKHSRHPNASTLEIIPSSAWRRWGFTSNTHTGKPGQRMQASPSSKSLLTATEAHCGDCLCYVDHIE